MTAMEKLIFKVADPIQEFIMRRLLGELQEVNEQITIRSINTDAP